MRYLKNSSQDIVRVSMKLHSKKKLLNKQLYCNGTINRDISVDKNLSIVTESYFLIFFQDMSVIKNSGIVP